MREREKKRKKNIWGDSNSIRNSWRTPTGAKQNVTFWAAPSLSVRKECLKLGYKQGRTLRCKRHPDDKLALNIQAVRPESAGAIILSFSEIHQAEDQIPFRYIYLFQADYSAHADRHSHSQVTSENVPKSHARQHSWMDATETDEADNITSKIFKSTKYILKY